jgi:hypothetical protein
MLTALRKSNYILSQIGNKDQMPAWFNMSENTTVNMISKRSVQIQMTGVEKQHCTIMLGIMADRFLLYVVFKIKIHSVKNSHQASSYGYKKKDG